jgi:nucleoside-diphosphate-sugar epimerase
VLVTGGAGFVGSNLILRLTRDYKAKVHVIDNLWRGTLENLEGKGIDVSKDVTIADLTSSDVCMKHIRDADVIFHLADIVAGVDFVFSNQNYVFRQNLLINSNVLAACAANGIKNYIYVGTACSFPQHLQMDENYKTVALHEEVTYPAEPESSYGWSKLMGEYEAALLQESGQMNVGILRLHNVYGPGNAWDPERSQALPSLIRKAIHYPKEDFTVWGSGNQYRDFLFIDDVIEGLILIAERGMNQGVIQIGTGAPTTLKQAATIVGNLSKALLNKPLAPTFDATKPEGDRGRIAVTDLAESILGWKATVGIEEGLHRTFEWVMADMEKKKKAAASPKELPFIPQMQPWFDDNEANAVSEYMRSGAYLTEFKQTAQFERMLEEFMGVKHAMAFNNGTVSLSVGLLAMGVRPNANHAVLVPNWTMVASPNSVQLAGATPIFMDVDKETYCIDIEQVRRAIVDKIDTFGHPITHDIKAVMHVSMNARSNDVQALMALCEANGVALLEDSAQALGSFHNGIHLGTIGHCGSFSFSSPKIISTGQGAHPTITERAHYTQLTERKLNV